VKELDAKLSRWKDEAEQGGVSITSVPVSEVVFDPRTVLKCQFGCPAWGRRWTCGEQAWGPDRLIPLLRSYRSVLILNGTDLEAVTSRALAIEREATVAGFPFALAVAVTLCSTCGACTYPDGACRKADDLRPESAMAGIHTLETLARLGIETQTEAGWLRTSYVFLD